MKRSARLQSARRWLESFEGTDVIRSYARWFKVDLGCALKELQLLDFGLDPVRVERLKDTLRNRGRPQKIPTPSDGDVPDGYGVDWDDTFAYIVGHTSGDAPFGLTWEEWEVQEGRERSQRK